MHRHAGCRRRCPHRWFPSRRTLSEHPRAQPEGQRYGRRQAPAPETCTPSASATSDRLGVARPATALFGSRSVVGRAERRTPVGTHSQWPPIFESARCQMRRPPSWPRPTLVSVLAELLDALSRCHSPREPAAALPMQTQCAPSGQALPSSLTGTVGSRPGKCPAGLWARKAGRLLPEHDVGTGLVGNAAVVLPRFRRFSLANTAYGEGWACTPNGWRGDRPVRRRLGTARGCGGRDAACRLVVGTGLHHLGWTRS